MFTDFFIEQGFSISYHFSVVKVRINYEGQILPLSLSLSRFFSDEIADDFITGRLIFRSTKGLGLAPSAVYFSLIRLSARSFWVFHFQDLYYMGFLEVCQGVLGTNFAEFFLGSFSLPFPFPESTSKS
jgi:hypothetical protein